MVRFVCLVCCLVGGIVPMAWSAVEYQLVDLGPTSAAAAISAEGAVVGSVTVPDAEGQRWQTAAILAPSQALIAQGAAHGVAGLEVVGGMGIESGGTIHAFTWNPTQGIRDLGTLGDAPLDGLQLFSSATGVNQTLTVSGGADAPGDVAARPVAWVQGVIQDLGTLGGATGFADAINALGDIVGYTETAPGQDHATLWPVDGGMLDLDGRSTGLSFGQALNVHRVVVGWATFATGAHGFRWTPATGLQDLGALPGHGGSSAMAINDAGVIVGWSQPNVPNCCPLNHAVRWARGRLVDLQTRVAAPGWTLEEARGINNAGVIVGNGRLNGERRAWMLVPVTPVVPAPPVALVTEVRGDFNQDEWVDIAGLASDSTIYRCLAGEPACTQLPGNAIGLAALDITGDGRDDLVAVSGDTALWTMTDGATWHQAPGYLAEVVSGDFYPGSRVLVGLDWGGQMWISADASTWQALPYYLEHITAGDFRGNGRYQLAGVDYWSSIWFVDSASQWSILPGNLMTIGSELATPDVMTGQAYDGSRWIARSVGHWEPAP